MIHDTQLLTSKDLLSAPLLTPYPPSHPTTSPPHRCLWPRPHQPSQERLVRLTATIFWCHLRLINFKFMNVNHWYWYSSGFQSFTFLLNINYRKYHDNLLTTFVFYYSPLLYFSLFLLFLFLLPILPILLIQLFHSLSTHSTHPSPPTHPTPFNTPTVPTAPSSEQPKPYTEPFYLVPNTSVCFTD